MLLVAAGAANAGPLAPQKASAPSRMTTAQAQRLWAARSAHFVENKGQWKPQARFYAKGKGVDLWFTDRGIRFDQRFAGNRKYTRQAVDLSFVGGNPVRFIGQDSDGTRQDVLKGKSPIRGIRAFHELVSRNVAPGVDLRAYYDHGAPRYDLVVAPGAKPSAIRMAFRGADGLSVVNGSLKVGTQGGGFFNGKPFAYQTVAGKRRPVFAKWVAQNGRTAGFSLGAYDASRPLVIDPIVFGTYFGGEDGNDEVRAAAADTFDATNSSFIVGTTTSPDFPANYGPFNDSFNPAGRDAFIARINSAGTVRDYAALFGSSGSDIAQYVKLDAEGNVWVAGTTTTGSNFFASSFTAGDVTGNSFFVIRFARQAAAAQPPVVSPTNPQIISAVFGMANNNKALSGFDLQPGAVGNVRFAFTGVTTDALTTDIVPNEAVASDTDAAKDVARTHGHFFEGHQTGFLVRFAINNATGDVTTDSVGSQYLEGVRVNNARGVVLDSADNAYVVGTLYKDPSNLLNVDTSVGTNYRFFETTPNVLSTLGATPNGYVTGRVQRATDVIVRKYLPLGVTKPVAPADAQKVNATIAFSGLLGGNGDDDAGGISTTPSTPNVVVANNRVVPTTQNNRLYTGAALALGPADFNTTGPTIYLTGTVNSSNNFPVTAGPKFDANPNVFVAKVSNDGSQIEYSTSLNVTANLVGPLAQQYYEPWIPTTVMPAGIAVDQDGFAFVTGNLRAATVTFPTMTPGTPNEMTASTLSSINLPNPLPADIADSTYDSPTGTELPTTEGFLKVLNPLGNSIQYQTYIGGILDDIVFAPALTINGNVLVPGWSDGDRFYQRIQGTTVKQYPRFGVSLPSTPQQNITPGAVKANPHAGALSADTLGYGLWATSGDQVNPLTISLNPQADGTGIGRDGLLLKYDVNLPQLAGITFLPTNIPGGLGASTTGTLNFTRATGGGTTVTLTLTGPGSFSSTNPNVTTTTVPVPQGVTNIPFTVFSNAVPSNQTVTVSAQDNVQAVSGSFTVEPWLQGVTLSQDAVTGGSATTVTATVALDTIPTAAEATQIQQQLTKVAVSNPSGVASLSATTVSTTAATATFTITTIGVDAASVPVSVRAILLGVTKGANLEVDRAKLVSLTYSPSPIPAGSQTTGTLTLDGKAGPAGLSVTVTGSPASASDLPQTVTFAPQASTATFVVTSKFVANDPTTVTTTATPSNDGPTVTGSFIISKFAVVSLSFSPNPIDPNSTTIPSTGALTSTGTVTLNTAATSPTRIDITVSNPSKIQVISGLVQDGPGQYHLTIATGSSTASFLVKAVNVGAQSTVDFTATRITGDSASATLTIKALNFTLGLTPNTVIGTSNATVTGTVTLTKSQPNDTTFTITSNDSTVLPNGTTVTIPAGQTSATFTFTVGASLQTKSVTITATLNGLSKSAILVIQPPSLIKVTPVQKTVRGGDYLDLDALFDAAPISSNARLVVTVSQRELFSGALDNFPISGNPTRIRLRTNRVSRSTNVTVTVTYQIRASDNVTVLSTSEASTTVTIAR